MSSPQPSSGALVVKPTSKFVLFSYALILTLTALAAIVAYRSEARREYLYAIYAAAAIALLATVKNHIRLQLTRLSMDAQGLKFQDGFLSKTTRMINLSKVQDVRVDQGIADRLLGIGTITLETAGESGRLVMQNIDQPHEVANHILSLAQSAGGVPRPA